MLGLLDMLNSWIYFSKDSRNKCHLLLVSKSRNVQVEVVKGRKSAILDLHGDIQLGLVIAELN